MVRFGIYLCAMCVVLFCGCGNASRGGEISHEVVTAAVAAKKAAYMPPVLPSTAKSPRARVDFVVEHYWDNYNFADTAQLANDYTESAFAAFACVLAQLDDADAKRGVGVMLSRASFERRTYDRFVFLSEKYLYDPNSPVRREALYMAVVEDVLSRDWVDKWTRVRYESQRQMMMRNAVGDVAADFEYETPTGARASLHSLASDWTVVFFNNPDCDDCQRIKLLISSSQTFRRALSARGAEGQPWLTILAVYPDEDVALWRQTTYPAEWVNGYDHKGVLRSARLYDLRAIPCLYLLDSQKRVVLKDAPIELIERKIAEAVGAQ